jgi:chromosome segregation ATPase
MMVSHRAEMQESASRLIGLYLRDQIPCVISLAFHDADERHAHNEANAMEDEITV